MQPGIHSISNDEYHSSEGISRSAIMDFKKAPYFYWHKYINSEYVKSEPTPAMRFGSALHTALLEPTEFLNRYVIEEKIDRRTKEGKIAYEKMIERNKGKIILHDEEMIKISNMCGEVFANDQTHELIKDAQYEKSIYWNDPDTGILCKVRPDIMHDVFVVDYKTTSDASEHGFQRSIYAYGYYLQAAMIHEAFNHALKKDLQAFIFLAQETTEPYMTAIYQLDQAAIEFGIEEFKKILWQIKECQETNYYPGYQTSIISLPNWSTK